MMPDTRVRRAGPVPAPRPASSTPAPAPAHTSIHTARSVHTPAPAGPRRARPRVDGPVGPARSVHTVRVLVHLARFLAPAAGGALLISAGTYAGPASLIPVPVLLALAAAGWAAPVGGER